MDTVEGILDDIVFQNGDDSYCVLRLKGKGVGKFTAVYKGSAPNVGATLRLEGEWVEHPRFGRQLAVANCQITTAGKPKRKRRRYVVSADPKLVNFLEEHGLSAAYAEKIEKVYHDTALLRIQTNPYCLMQDVDGIGFKLSDRLALGMGVEKDAPERIRAGLYYVLGDMSAMGHVCIPEDNLISQTGKTLGCENRQVREICHDLVNDALLCTEDYGGVRYVYPDILYEAEVETATALREMNAKPRKLTKVDADAEIEEWEKESGLNLADQQKEAIYASLQHGVFILTGGPGTGKTTVVKGIMNVLTKAGCSILLAAPTGRAARRLAESCGQSAKTVHRLLEYKPRDEGYHSFVFDRNEDNPLDGDAVIVDEASMLDLFLTYNLLKAIPRGCRLIFVGDVDQLPSVGAGSVLKDMIASGVLPVVRLTNIFRQAHVSPIVRNAHVINQGRDPEFQADSDFDLREFVSEEEGAQFIIHKYSEAVKNLDWESVQVLSPMHRGPCGVQNLNKLLQQHMNPPAAGKNEFRLLGNIFRTGDKIMQTKNNYEKEVFNGDVGRINEINGQTVTVEFPDRPEGELVKYTALEAEELQLAYAMSVHKSQGSEYPFVILAMVPSHYIMLQRNLLYTAVTRAKQKVLLVGSKKAVRQAVINNRTRNRYSLLKQRLQDQGECFE